MFGRPWEAERASRESRAAQNGKGVSMDRLLVVGLDEPEYLDLKRRVNAPVVYSELLPRIQIERSRLLVEKPNTLGIFVPASKVIFHGIFEDDFPFLTALALWGGPCLPNGHGMMDCRLRLPC